MNIPYKTRQLYPDELRFLKALATKKSKERFDKIKFYHFVIAGFLAIALTCVAIITNIGFLRFLFGTIAVFAYGFIILAPFEIYKARRKNKSFVNDLSKFVDKGTVDTYLINAKRIAVAEEHEDEGDLFIIELDTYKVLYLWDYDYNLRKKFPCLDFEIYEEKFFKVTGRQVYPLSAPVKAMVIDKKSKWNYMRKIGAPGHLETQIINFDDLMADYNSCV
jgi:hypothetical protein